MEAHRVTSSFSSLPYCLKPMFLKHLIPIAGATLHTVFSMLLEVLDKYWYCLLRHLRTEVPIQKSLRKISTTQKGKWSSFWKSTGRAVFMALLRNVYCLWKCHLACCPCVRRNSNNPKALCLHWLRKELAFGFKGKGETPKEPFFFSLWGWSGA